MCVCFSSIFCDHHGDCGSVSHRYSPGVAVSLSRSRRSQDATMGKRNALHHHLKLVFLFCLIFLLFFLFCLYFIINIFSIVHVFYFFFLLFYYLIFNFVYYLFISKLFTCLFHFLFGILFHTLLIYFLCILNFSTKALHY